MNIMLTGATGNLGHHITSQAIEHGIDRFYIGVRN
ncbi:putative nucleoside-diphosphate-sugar epimerase [Staphylococcus warneri]|nr:putative nucleoside-diphosphate-sugar epimerase [Staphylococcus warneri]